MFDDSEVIDNEIAYSPEILGAECQSCRKLLGFRYFRKDSSLRLGHKPQCMDCESQPKLTMEEHLSRQREQNFNSEGTKRQRHPDQDNMKLKDARLGRQMHCSEFLLRLQRLVPALFVKEGGIVGDLALYLVADTPQAKWDGKNFKYMGFLTYEMLPEFSRYEFETVRDVMIRESERGWRTPLLRFIKDGLITEDQCRQEFGAAVGEGSMTWHKTLWNYRNENVTPQD
jgi:hypothetical protein